MAEFGINVKRGSEGARVALECPHQNGLLYAVPAEASWVCSQDLLPAHALAGFLGDLVKLGDSRISDLMQRWGLYFRQGPLASQGEESGTTPAEAPQG